MAGSRTLSSRRLRGALRALVLAAICCAITRPAGAAPLWTVVGQVTSSNQVPGTVLVKPLDNSQELVLVVTRSTRNATSIRPNQTYQFRYDPSTGEVIYVEVPRGSVVARSAARTQPPKGRQAAVRASASHARVEFGAAVPTAPASRAPARDSRQAGTVEQCEPFLRRFRLARPEAAESAPGSDSRQDWFHVDVWTAGREQLVPRQEVAIDFEKRSNRVTAVRRMSAPKPWLETAEPLSLHRVRKQTYGPERKLRSGEGAAATVFASPDSSRVVLADARGSLTVWDRRDGAVSAWRNTDWGRQGGASASGFWVCSADARRAAFVPREFQPEETIAVWQIGENEPTLMRPAGLRIHSAAISDEGFLYLGAAGGFLHIASVTSPRCDYGRRVSQAAVVALRLVAQETQLLSGTSDGRLCLLSSAGEVLREIGTQGEAVTDLACDTDLQAVLSTGRAGVVHLWDALRHAEVRRFAGLHEVSCLALLGDRGFLLVAARSADGQSHVIYLWNLATRLPVALFQAHSHPVTSLAVLDGGQAFLSADAQGHVFRWAIPAEGLSSEPADAGAVPGGGVK